MIRCSREKHGGAYLFYKRTVPEPGGVVLFSLGHSR